MNNQILKAVETLNNGGVILLPTETVYGIAVDASNNSAIEKIYCIKKRDVSKPLQIMVKDVEAAKKLGYFNEKAEQLADKHWPGALTIILKARPNQLGKFNVINDTIGIRIPDNAYALAVLNAFNRPIAVTSSNISGMVPTINFHDSVNTLTGIDMAIDGGESALGISSTVVDLTDMANVKILRQGSVIID